MTEPANIKKIYKNIDWKNKDEKRAFFNHYFKNSEFVDEITKPLHYEIEQLEAEIKGLKK